MSALDRLRATGLTQRLNSYDSSIDELDSSIGSKKLTLAEQLKGATKPKENKMQDALIQAVISLTPALLGYAAAGKEGAYFGLKGGQTGSKIYGDTLTERHTDEVNKSKLDASQTQAELEALSKRKDKLDDRSMSLQDKFVLQEDNNSRKDARTDRMIGAGGFFGRPPTQPTDAATTEESDTTSASKDYSQDELDNAGIMLEYFNSTPEGQKFIEENDVKTTKGFLDVINKIKDAKAQDLTNAGSSLDLEDKTIEKSSRESVNDFGFTKAKPTGKTSSKQLEEAKKLVPHYSALHRALKDMATIADTSGGAGRTIGKETSAAIKDARDRAAKAYVGLMHAKETDPGKSVFTSKQAEAWVPGFGDVGSEIASGIRSLPLVPGAPLTDTLEAKIEGVQKMLYDDLEARGFEVVDDTASGSSGAVFQDPVTGKMYDANYQEIK